MWSYAVADKHFTSLLLDHPEGKKLMKRLLMAMTSSQDGLVGHGLHIKNSLAGFSAPTLYPFSGSLMSHVLKFEY